MVLPYLRTVYVRKYGSLERPPLLREQYTRQPQGSSQMRPSLVESKGAHGCPDEKPTEFENKPPVVCDQKSYS